MTKIRYRLSQVCKVIDGFSGKPLSDAVIVWKYGKRHQIDIYGKEQVSNDQAGRSGENRFFDNGAGIYEGNQSLENVNIYQNSESQIFGAGNILENDKSQILSNENVYRNYEGRAVDTENIGKSEKNRFINKGGGFYAAVDWEAGRYQVQASCRGYEPGNFYFNVDPDRKTDEIFLISLIPDRPDLRIEVNGILKIAGKPASNRIFYYTADCDAFRKRLMADVKKDVNRIRLHTYGDESLEGRKFAVEGAEGIYTLGTFDYVDLQYKLSRKASSDVESGEPVFLLFDGQTDVNGEFSIVLPRFIAEESCDVLFFTERKSCRVSFDFGNMPEKVEVGL